MSDNNININTPEIGPYTQLRPFRFWCQKVLPLVYDESLSYYELLCKVVDYLNKTMEDVDQMITDIGEFQTADRDFKTDMVDRFIAFTRGVDQTLIRLEDYIDNYFNNLNVQTEINNKLDAMAEAGYFDTLFTTLFTSDIITEAGNVTSAWIAANLLQETGYVLDSSLTVANAAADAKATGDAIKSVNTIVSKTLLNGFTDLTEDGYYGGAGEVIASTTYKHSETYVEIEPSTTYSVWWARYNLSFSAMSASFGVCTYDKDKNFIARQTNVHEFTTEANAKYIRTYLSANAYPEYLYSMLIKGTTRPSFFVPYGYDVKTMYEEKSGKKYEDSFKESLALIDALSISGGTKEYILDNETAKTQTAGHYTNAILMPIESVSWNTYRADIAPDSIYYYKAVGSTGAFALVVLDNKNRVLLTVPETIATGQQEGYLKMPPTADHVIMNESGTTVSLKKVTGIRFVGAGSPVLAGKKLYCGGDSITEGANVGSFPNGYKKTYGGIVAYKNNMVYVADGVGGSTMGKCTIDGSVYNNFITSRYQNIPTDSDFITLWFGWNDQAYGWKSARDEYCVATYGTYYTALTSAQQAEVDAYKTWRQWLAEYAGTTDSSSITTWAGAWNTVLTWLITNCPDARVGIIIAYGMEDELINVLIALCEKYGVSYIKAYDPHEFFSVGHSKGIGSDQAAARKALFTLDGTHPNEKGYEMMANGYEQFLERI